MPTVEELQAELAKRDQQIRGLSVKLQAHERIAKELGDAVEYDGYGNPVTLRVENEPAAPVAMSANGHPMSSLSQLIDGWDPQSLDAYYQRLFQQQGYLTTAQFQQYQTDLSKQIEQYVREQVLGNITLFDGMRELLGNKDYADLNNFDSPLSKRTLDVLSKNGYGQPLDGAKSWKQISYRDPEGLNKAARVARAELFMEAQANHASLAAAKTAQGANNTSPAPVNTGSGASGAAPKISEMKSEEDVLNALDQAFEANPRAG